MSLCPPVPTTKSALLLVSILSLRLYSTTFRMCRCCSRSNSCLHRGFPQLQPPACLGHRASSRQQSWVAIQWAVSDLLHCHFRTLLCNATGGWGTSFVKSCWNTLKFFTKTYQRQKGRICRLSLYNMIIFLSECYEYLSIPHLVFMTKNNTSTAKNNTSKPANKYAWKTGIGFHSVSVLICFPTLLKHLLRLVEEYVH